MTQRFTKIDRPALQTIQQAAQKALEAVAEQYGVTITLSPGRYSNAQTGQITFGLALPDDNGQAQTADEILFKRNAFLWGLTADDFGQVFTHGAEQFRVTGCNPKKPKYSIKCERVGDSKPYNFPSQAVRDALALKRLRAKAA